MKKILNKKAVSYTISILVNIISAIVITIGVKVFISPNKFLSTGFTGIALVVGRIYDNIFTPEKSLETTIASVVFLIINIPVLILGWKKLSHKFTICSLVFVIVTTITMAFIPDDIGVRLHLSVANGDISYLDAALFVGMLNGCANALAYIFDGSTGGIDIISMYYSVRKQISIGRVTTLMNGVTLILGLFIDGSEMALSKAFYTLVYIVINSIVIDLFYVRNKRTILFITTSKGDEVANEIMLHFVRGVTRMDVKGGYTGNHKDLIYCACSSFEVKDIIQKVVEIDEHAFVSVIAAEKIHGNFISKVLR